MIKKAHQTLKILKCDLELATPPLNLSVGEPIAEVRRIIYGIDNTIIYFADITYRGDSVQLDIEFHI